MKVLKTDCLKTWKVLTVVIAAASCVVLLLSGIKQKSFMEEQQKKTIFDKEFRADFFSDKMWENEEFLSAECKTLLLNVDREAVFFPVPESSVDKSLKTSYINSWGSERTYSGKRTHEGTDIMAMKNVRGIYPVLSVCDGTVTNIGWLKKGGYRLGITSDSGTYYYYAHLDSYSNIVEGDFVHAGELIGYMGDSGYGREGTVGKFDVHLHFGIYIYRDGKEVSVNPYYLLKMLEKKKLKYQFS